MDALIQSTSLAGSAFTARDGPAQSTRRGQAQEPAARRHHSSNAAAPMAAGAGVSYGRAEAGMAPRDGPAAFFPSPREASAEARSRVAPSSSDEGSGGEGQSPTMRTGKSVSWGKAHTKVFEPMVIGRRRSGGSDGRIDAGLETQADFDSGLNVGPASQPARDHTDRRLSRLRRCVAASLRKGESVVM